MASLIDKYAKYMSRRKSSGDGVARRIFDPNYMTPDVFYAMDEIGPNQVLHRFDKSPGAPVYAGTFHILFKTEDMDRFCLIMRRIKDRWRTHEKYAGSYEEEKGVFVVAQYYPGTEGRIYLKGLDEKAMERIITRYHKKSREILELPAVSLPEK